MQKIFAMYKLYSSIKYTEYVSISNYDEIKMVDCVKNSNEIIAFKEPCICICARFILLKCGIFYMCCPGKFRGQWPSFA